MPTLEGFTELNEEFGKLLREAKEANCSVSTGFTQYYAVYVHEDMEAHHPVGQAKYLEQPAREMHGDGTLANLVVRTIRAGGTVLQGLLVAGLALQRAAQLLCPVDTGALRASAFTAKEQEVEQAAQVAFEASEAIREGAKSK